MNFVEELPPRLKRSYRGKWRVMAEELQANPGQWAELKRTPKGAHQSGAYAGQFRRFFGDGFEGAQRTVDGEVIVYLRYNPKGS